MTKSYCVKEKKTDRMCPWIGTICESQKWSSYAKM